MTEREYRRQLLEEMLAKQEIYKRRFLELEEKKRAIFRKLAAMPGIELSPEVIAYANRPVEW
jgi:hypothetical protein